MIWLLAILGAVALISLLERLDRRAFRKGYEAAKGNPISSVPGPPPYWLTGTYTDMTTLLMAVRVMRVDKRLDTAVDPGKDELIERLERCERRIEDALGQRR